MSCTDHKLLQTFRPTTKVVTVDGQSCTRHLLHLFEMTYQSITTPPCRTRKLLFIMFDLLHHPPELPENCIILRSGGFSPPNPPILPPLPPSDLDPILGSGAKRSQRYTCVWVDPNTWAKAPEGGTDATTLPKAGRLAGSAAVLIHRKKTSDATWHGLVVWLGHGLSGGFGKV